MNRALIEGKVLELTVEHGFYIGLLSVKRTSGTEDIIPFKIPKENQPGDWLAIAGRVVTENYIGKDGKSHKKMYVYGTPVTHTNEYINYIEFDGYLISKQPIRKTPFGKQIIDSIFAVNITKYSYYIPCIAWYSRAEEVDALNTGEKVKITGRFQSREYQKRLEDDTVETRTAYEVSIFSLERENKNEK